jgi:hypothetical protein
MRRTERLCTTTEPLMEMNTIDVAWLVGNLPAELGREIKNFTFLMQMQDMFKTDDLEKIAFAFIRYNGIIVGMDLETIACWLDTLVSTRV